MMGPALLHVGGNWNNGSNAGVRAANANNSPGNANTNIGFRLANCVPPAVLRLRPHTRAYTHHTRALRPAWAKHQTRRRQRVGRPKPEAGIHAMSRTYKHLFERVCDFSNLYLAWQRARKGKRYRPDVLAFSADVGGELLRLQAELRELAWRPGGYQIKIVREPKRREIRVAPFRDRIVHQALCAVIAPLFEATWIHDSYACRVGKGSHAAVDRLTAFLRKSGSHYVLKGDLRKYFDSIPHGLVMRELEWRIADGRVLELCRRILASYKSGFPGPPGFGPRGLPIGNLTSQWFANIVGNRLDQFVKHDLGCRRYIRYMDDWLLLGPDKGVLRGWRSCIERFVEELGLVVNPKTQIIPAGRGVPFLGFRVWADHRRVLRPNVVAGRRRLRRAIRRMLAGEEDPERILASLRSWYAHLRHADTYRLRCSLWKEFGPALEEAAC